MKCWNWTSVLLFVALALTGGCEAGGPGVGGGGGGVITDGGRSVCTPGAPGVRCDGTQAVQCLPDGTEGGRADCGAAGQVCSEGVGCTVCVANRYRCLENGLEQCNADGTAWVALEICDAAAGQVCNAGVGRCESLCDSAARENSYIGCEYWPVTTLNSQVDQSFSPAVAIANPQAQSAQVTITGPSGFSTSQTVAAGAVTTIELPWVSVLKGDAMAGEASALVRGGAYRLVSTVPVTVYQYNPLEYQGRCDGLFGSEPCFSYSNDASLLLPSHVMTGNYIVVSRPTLQMERTDPLFGGTQLSSSPGFFTVVGVDSAAVTVNISFSAYVSASVDGQVQSFRPGQTGAFSLNQGDVLQVVGDAPSTCAGGAADETGTRYCQVGQDYDLTGTEIRSTGPVEVIGGHNCAFIPYNRWACDHLEEALFPLEAWGTSSIVSHTQPLRGEPNLVRIVSGDDNNTLTFEPSSIASSVTLARGQSVEFEARESFRVTGTGALLVAQHLVGQDYAGVSTGGIDGEGDPSFSLGIPSEQFRTSYSFLAPSTYPTNYVNVTAPNGATVLLDGNPVTGFEAVGSTGFQTARVSIGAGQHMMTSSAAFGIVLYGFGSYTSYMYPGGLDLNEINVPF